MFAIIKMHVGHCIPSLRNDRRAAGALDHALLSSFIAIALIGAVTQFGGALSACSTTAATTIGEWGAGA